LVVGRKTIVENELFHGLKKITGGGMGGGSSGVFDLLLTNEKVIDGHYGIDKILCLRPGEGTEDVVQRACNNYAKKRGYEHVGDGGILNDSDCCFYFFIRNGLKCCCFEMYQMFCCFLFCRLKSIIGKSVHEYVNDGTLAKLGLEQSTVTKLKTRKVLPLDGLPVLVNDNDVTLPNGDTVLNGAALLVPCGVLSESINAGNMGQLLDEEGVYRFKNVINGGRFVTADARATLEDAGVILVINDASAKKSGVNTSSSMEVSAVSSLANEELGVHDMRVPTNWSKDAPRVDKGKLT
jgi:hypothetical protein